MYPLLKNQGIYFPQSKREGWLLLVWFLFGSIIVYLFFFSLFFFSSHSNVSLLNSSFSYAARRILIRYHQWWAKEDWCDGKEKPLLISGSFGSDVEITRQSDLWAVFGLSTKNHIGINGSLCHSGSFSVLF